MAERSSKHSIAPIVVLFLAITAFGLLWWLLAALTNASSPAKATWGTVEADEYQISALATGTVTEVFVAAGDQVKIGDTLVQLDDAAAKLVLEQAQQQVAAEKANVEKEKNNSKAERDMAAAKLKQAEAAAAYAQLQVDNMTIVSSVNGKVTAVLTNPGAVSTPGKALLTVLDPSSTFVRAYVPQTMVEQLSVGQEVTLASPYAQNSAKTYGRISFVSATAEFTPNTAQTIEQQAKLVYEIRINQLKGNSSLNAGMSVEIKF
ncbi:MAG: efflux RND transporter periplasmic adaptor subunit [Propionibacteriaceae bacterium]|nr:efflux RND transporter periplasmic adaptor subunit [Propionibacteriaceae bacterium]